MIAGELIGWEIPQLPNELQGVLSLYDLAERMQSLGGVSAGEILGNKSTETPKVKATFPDFQMRRQVLDESGVAGEVRARYLRLFEVIDTATLEVIEEAR